MLLVDDDQAEIGERREHGRARPHADPRRTRSEPAPLVEALAGGERRMQHRDPVAEARAEAMKRLRR